MKMESFSRCGLEHRLWLRKCDYRQGGIVDDTFMEREHGRMRVQRTTSLLSLLARSRCTDSTLLGPGTVALRAPTLTTTLLMPKTMNNRNSMTIAFSLKSNMWTMEHSFESTRYGMTDNRMLSLNVDRIGRPTGVSKVVASRREPK